MGTGGKKARRRNKPLDKKKGLRSSRHGAVSENPAVLQKRPVKLSRRKLWVFRSFAAVAFPFLALAVLEGVLRIAGYGFVPAAAIERKVEGSRCLVSNDSFARLYFPAKLARQFDPFVIGLDKHKESCRVVVLGASAVQGVPDGAYSFSRMLEVLLEDAYPTVDFEVFNAGMTAINSHCVLQIAKDLRDSRADVLVVYLGNNEVVGPYGAGTVFSPLRSDLSLIRAGTALRRFRLGQLVSSVGAARRNEQIQRWGGMQMYLEHLVGAADERLSIVYDHYLANLRDICSIGRSMGASVVLSTVAVNIRDCPPFASMHREGLDDKALAKWQADYDKAVALETQGSAKEAVATYLSCAAIDDEFADLQFRLGRMFDKSGDYEKAAEHYNKAKELDALRFRADDRINSIIRQTAAEDKGGNIYLADAAQAANNTEHVIPGDRLFHEHVHLTFEGNAVVAEAILAAIEEALPPRIRAARVLKAKISVAELAGRLAFTDVDRLVSDETMLEVYLTKPPFTSQLYHAERISELQERIERMRSALTVDSVDRAAAVYGRAIEGRPDDWWLKWKYAELLSVRLNDTRGAIKQVREALKLVPQFCKGHVQLGTMLVETGEFNQGRKCYEEALRLHPDDVEACFAVALLFMKEDRPEEAVNWYRTVLAIDSGHKGAHLNLGATLSAIGRGNEAVEAYEQAAKALCEDADIHYNLGVLYYRQGQKIKAIESVRRSLELEPDSEEIARTLSEMEKD